MPLTKDFLKLKSSLREQYLGERVPKQYQGRYGKRYDKPDIESMSYAIAKSKKIKIDGRTK